LHKLLGYEKDLLLATTPRKQQQKLLGTTISLRWWASLYNLLNQVNIFICKILIFLAFYKALSALVLMYPSRSSSFWDMYNFYATLAKTMGGAPSLLFSEGRIAKVLDGEISTNGNLPIK
jgi:hypothetical protein